MQDGCGSQEARMTQQFGVNHRIARTQSIEPGEKSFIVCAALQIRLHMHTLMNWQKRALRHF